MSTSLNIHNVIAIRLVDASHDGHSWAKLTLVSLDHAGREQTFEIVAFPANDRGPLRVEQPAAADAQP